MFGDRNKRDGRQSRIGVDGNPIQYSQTELIQIMERMPFFAALKASDRRNLASVGIERSYPTGAELVREGQEPGIGVYVILSGRVRVTQSADDGTAHQLRELGPGEMFGELALLNEQPRSASVTALEPTVALVIPLFDFRPALDENPKAKAALQAMLSERERNAAPSDH
jgi:CRP/FNR family transcriptional regulator